MSDLIKNAMQAIKERAKEAAGEFNAGTLTAAQFHAEADLLSVAYRSLEAAMAKRIG